MNRILILAALAAALIGCSSADEIFLTPNEAEALSENFEAAVDTQQQMSEYVFAVARGDIDLAAEFDSYTYIPPSDLNNWVGTLTVTGGTFPFGTGDLDIDFTAYGDGVTVDPYVFDLTAATEVQIDAVVDFVGTSNLGRALETQADFVMTTVQNAADSATTLLDGTFRVVHDGYVANFNASNVQFALDLLLQEVTNVSGTVSGTVDIPDFAWDADFEVNGLGDRVEITLDVVATSIRYTLSLAEL